MKLQNERRILNFIDDSIKVYVWIVFNMHLTYFKNNVPFYKFDFSRKKKKKKTITYKFFIKLYSNIFLVRHLSYSVQKLNNYI